MAAGHHRPFRRLHRRSAICGSDSLGMGSLGGPSMSVVVPSPGAIGPISGAGSSTSRIAPFKVSPVGKYGGRSGSGPRSCSGSVLCGVLIEGCPTAADHRGRDRGDRPSSTICQGHGATAGPIRPLDVAQWSVPRLQHPRSVDLTRSPFGPVAVRRYGSAPYWRDSSTSATKKASGWRRCATRWRGPFVDKGLTSRTPSTRGIYCSVLRRLAGPSVGWAGAPFLASSAQAPYGSRTGACSEQKVGIRPTGGGWDGEHWRA